MKPFVNWTGLDLNISINTHRGHGDDLGGHGHGNDPSGLDLPPASGAEEWGSCMDWQEAQHTLFQLANLCAAVSLLTPSSFRHHLLFLRCLLLVAFLLFVLWAGLFVCMLDIMVWNGVFFLVDLGHIMCLVYSNIPARFSPSFNELYTKRFKPLKVCRSEFAQLCNTASIIPLRKGSHYAFEGITPCGEKVSILLRGRLKVSHANVFLHLIEANEFVDSPEFDSVPFRSETSEKFQVTVVAREDSLLLSWLYPSLRCFLSANPFLWTIFSHLVGKDVSDKLYRIQELMLREPGATTSSNSSPTAHPTSMLQVRKEVVRSSPLLRPPVLGNGKPESPSAFQSQSLVAFS